MDKQEWYGTLDLIIEAYTQVADGKSRVDLDNGFGVVVKAYRCGTIIRIDVKGDE